jgi:hypothetical protein
MSRNQLSIEFARNAASSLLAALLLACLPAGAATPNTFTGKITGFVKSSAGVAQMGATVILLNRFDKPLYKTMTDERGAFRFDALGPDSYSVRVTLSSFLPAFRNGIQIQPGAERYLAIQLASLFSSIELLYAPPKGSVMMSEDWKSALRVSLNTRPVLRALPTWNTPTVNDPAKLSAAIFKDTKGMLRVSGGDGPSSSLGSQTDLGTAFAVGTSLFGRNELKFAGNLGYGSAIGMPATSFRTSYQRREASPLGFELPNPELSLTMRQILLPMRGGLALSGSPAATAPMLRTLSATVADRMQFGEALLLEYGASLDSVQYFERLNYISPFARLSWDGGRLGTLQAAFSSGLPPVDLVIAGKGEDADMQRHLASLALFPKITRRGGNTYAQRVKNFEIGYSRKLGRGEIFASVYRETVSNAGISILGAPAELLGAELVPDLSSNASIFNIGNYRRNGFVAGWTQEIAGDWKISTAYGLGGGLRTDQRQMGLQELALNAGLESSGALQAAASVRSSIHSQQRQFLSARISGTAPVIGTRFYGSYLWTDYRALSPFHTSLTGQGLADAGLNIGIHQPLPRFLGGSKRLELTAEMRNMLAQGYVPILTPQGQRMWLIPTPKQVRGGLSFIF